MDTDLNSYDTEHAVVDHPKMSRSEWEGVYREAWSLFYTPQHCETVLRRAAAVNIDLGPLARTLAFFSQFVSVEQVHPLQGGLFRRKYRADRRPGYPIEPSWSFYPKHLLTNTTKLMRMAKARLQVEKARRAIARDPTRSAYQDDALAPVIENEIENLELLTRDQATRDAVQHILQVNLLTGAK